MKPKGVFLTIFFVAILGGCNLLIPQTNQTQTSPLNLTDDATGSADETTMDDDFLEDDSAMVEDDVVTDQDPVQDAMSNQVVEIQMSSFAYSVKEIKAKPGETVTVNLVNAGGSHDFDIDELDIDTEVITTGQENTVDITIPQDAVPGTEYAYYCSVGNHRAQGMEGTIIVQ
jgi:plastocyanin